MSRRLGAGFLAAALSTAPLVAALARQPQECVPVENVLWGDGEHDDTRALNAWLRGEPAIWADSGAPVGAAIAGRNFRLSAAIYVQAGTGRRVADFRFSWPERGEIVSGGTIEAGGDADKPPAMAGVTITGGDPGEGKPFDAPPAVATPKPEAGCATS